MMKQPKPFRKVAVTLDGVTVHALAFPMLDAREDAAKHLTSRHSRKGRACYDCGRTMESYENRKTCAQCGDKVCPECYRLRHGVNCA